MKIRLDTIQALRAIAALAVVFYHAIEATARSYPDGALPPSVTSAAWLGNAGVDIFFVISGFIMIYAHYDDFAEPNAPARFLSNRLKRIVPNYWLLTTVGVLVLMLMPGLSQHGRTFDIPWIIASYLFVPWTSEAGIPVPVLGLGWTLNFEMYFYLFFSMALMFPRRTGLALLALVFALSILAGMMFEPQGPLLKQATSWLLAEFLTGVALGIAFKTGIRVPPLVSILLIVLAVPVLMVSLSVRDHGGMPQYLRFVFFGLPALAIVTAATLSERAERLRMPRLVVLLGNSSYALYLSHAFTLPFTVKLLSGHGLTLPYLLTVAILIVTAMLVGVAFYILFERPTQMLLRPSKVARTI